MRSLSLCLSEIPAKGDGDAVLEQKRSQFSICAQTQKEKKEKLFQNRKKREDEER